MMYAVDRGVYLFLYTMLEDGPCEFDEWYDSVDHAERDAQERFGVKTEDWISIDDPVPDAQHDWIRPTRTKCDSAGNKLWGQFKAIEPER